jgi:hypothetical protein
MREAGLIIASASTSSLGCVPATAGAGGAQQMAGVLGQNLGQHLARGGHDQHVAGLQHDVLERRQDHLPLALDQAHRHVRQPREQAAARGLADQL